MARVRVSWRERNRRVRPEALQRRSASADGGHRPPLQQIVYERFLFFRFGKRLVDLVAAKFVDRHVLHDFPFAAPDMPSDNSPALP